MLHTISKSGVTQISYAYDDVGNIKTVTDKKGFKTTYTYDQRFSRLEVKGKVDYNDKIIFGTGDSMRILTISADSKFVRAAAGQTVALDNIKNKPKNNEPIVTFNYIDATSNSSVISGRIKQDPNGCRVYIHDPVSFITQ